MTDTGTAPPEGILTPDGGEQPFDLRWHEPSDDLAFFVERHWIVEWDLRGAPPYRSDVLTDPCVNVVFEPDGPLVYGADTRMLGRVLEGAGWCVATRFRAAGFQPFSRSHLSDLTGRVVPLAAIFQMPDPAPDVLGAADDGAAIELVEDVLRAQRPARDPNVELVDRMVTEIVDDRLLTTVEDVADRFHIPPRALRRLFARYVGASPEEYLRRAG